MASLTLTLTPEAAARLEREAQARGMSVEAVAAEALEAWVGDEDWEEDFRRLAEPGENIPLDEAFDRFEEKVAALRAGRDKT